MEQKMIRTARETVVKYYNDRADDEIAYNETFIVWFSKTLQNWKALVGTTKNDLYFELTYNGDKNEIYLDAYKKAENVVIKGDAKWD